MPGIDDVSVLNAQQVYGEGELTVETTTEPDWCLWGARTIKDRPTVAVRDVDVSGDGARLRWRKRRWRCPEPACSDGSWTQQHPARRTNDDDRTRPHARMSSGRPRRPAGRGGRAGRRGGMAHDHARRRSTTARIWSTTGRAAAMCVPSALMNELSAGGSAAAGAVRHR
jgi:hypothetical protein